MHGDVTSEINAAAIAVHKEIGPGFLESIYEEALCVEFERRGIAYERQKPIRVRYRGVPVGLYRLDLIVQSKVVVEIKALDSIETVHLAITLAYLKATDLQVGLIVNFGGSIMRSRRVFRELDGFKEPENHRIRKRQEPTASPRMSGTSHILPEDPLMPS